MLLYLTRYKLFENRQSHKTFLTNGKISDDYSRSHIVLGVHFELSFVPKLLQISNKKIVILPSNQTYIQIYEKFKHGLRLLDLQLCLKTTCKSFRWKREIGQKIKFLIVLLVYITYFWIKIV